VGLGAGLIGGSVSPVVRPSQIDLLVLRGPGRYVLFTTPTVASIIKIFKYS